MQVKFETSLTKQQIMRVYAYLGLAVVTLIVGGYVHAVSYGNASGLVAVGITFSFIGIGLHAGNYFNIVQLSKSSDRRDRCHGCGRVSKRISLKDFESGEKYSPIADSKPDIPVTAVDSEKTVRIGLTGIIFRDHVYCTDCIKEIGKFKWPQ